MSSNITLQTTIDVTSRYIYNAPLLFINSGALAYSIGDWVRQSILAPPFAWRWNRSALSPVTCVAGKSDYTVAVADFGWLERSWISYPVVGGNSLNILTATRTSGSVTLVVGGNPALYGFGGGQTITVGNVADPSFNGYQAFQISSLTANSITYSQAGSNTTSTGGLVIGYSSTSTNPQLTKELSIYESLAQETVLGTPSFISVINDDNNGNITFRLMPIPDQQYQLQVLYQKASPVFGSTMDTWNPIPDYMRYLYELGFLAKTYEYKGDERFAFSHQEFLKALISANDGVLETSKNIFLEPKLVTARQQGGLQTSQQARAGRGGA